MATYRLLSSVRHTGLAYQRLASLLVSRNCVKILGDSKKTTCDKFGDRYTDRNFSSIAGSHRASMSCVTQTQQIGPNCRSCFIQRCSTLPDKGAPGTFNRGQSNKVVCDSDYKLVYRFSRIKAMRAVSQLKIYQTAVVVMSTPVVIHMYNSGVLTGTEAGAMTGFSVMAALMLFVMSNFFRKVVGLMYVNDDATSIKISHLTFWSRRRNVYLDISDIVPLSDSAQSPSNAYIRLDTYRNTDKFYLFLAYGGNIIDKDTLQKVLGQF